MAVGRIQRLEAVGLRSLFSCWPSPRGHYQSIEVLKVPRHMALSGPLTTLQLTYSRPAGESLAPVCQVRDTHSVMKSQEWPSYSIFHWLEASHRLHQRSRGGDYIRACFTEGPLRILPTTDQLLDIREGEICRTMPMSHVLEYLGRK